VCSRLIYYISLANGLSLQCNYDEMMVRYKQLLTYIKSAVTRNHSEKSINSILDYISTSKNVSPFLSFVFFHLSLTIYA